MQHIIKAIITNDVTSIEQYEGNVNITNISGDTLLHIAASWNRLEIVETLIKKGAGMRIKNQYNNTAHDVAKIHKNFNICDIFVREMGKI